MRRRTLILAAVLLAIAISVAAAGATSVLGPTAGTSVATETLSWTGSDTMVFNQFNVPGATLIGFSISLDGTITSDFSLTNTGNSSEDFTMTGEGALSLKDPAASNTTVVTTLPSTTLSTGLYGGALDPLPQGDTYTDDGVMYSKITSAVWYNSVDPSYMLGVSGDSHHSNATVVSNFVGPGTITLDAFGTSLNSAGATGSYSSNISGAAGATGTITYYYDETTHTPEVGTFGLMGLSMLPVVGVAIRRRKRS